MSIFWGVKFICFPFYFLFNCLKFSKRKNLNKPRLGVVGSSRRVWPARLGLGYWWTTSCPYTHHWGGSRNWKRKINALCEIEDCNGVKDEKEALCGNKMKYIKWKDLRPKIGKLKFFRQKFKNIKWGWQVSFLNWKICKGNNLDFIFWPRVIPLFIMAINLFHFVQSFMKF